MTIFAIIPVRDDHTIRDALEKQGIPFWELPRGEFLASFKGTSIDLSGALGVTDGSSGNAVIVAVGSYYGRASTDTWEWIKANWEG